MDGDRIIQALPRKGIRHLFSGGQSLLSFLIVISKVVDGVRGGNSGGLHIVSVGDGGTNTSSSSLEGDNRTCLSEFGPELGNHKVSRKEGDAIRDGDAEIL